MTGNNAAFVKTLCTAHMQEYLFLATSFQVPVTDGQRTVITTVSFSACQ
jgi:hypothetical protein